MKNCEIQQPQKSQQVWVMIAVDQGSCVWLYSARLSSVWALAVRGLCVSSVSVFLFGLYVQFVTHTWCPLSTGEKKRKSCRCVVGDPTANKVKNPAARKDFFLRFQVSPHMVDIIIPRRNETGLIFLDTQVLKTKANTKGQQRLAGGAISHTMHQVQVHRVSTRTSTVQQ